MLTRNTQRVPGWSETFTGEPRNIPPVAVETTARIELPISYGRSLPPMPHQIPNTRRKRPTERTRHLGHFGDRTKRNRPHPPIRKNWCSRCAVSHSTQMVALGRPHANGSMCRLEAGWGRWPSVEDEGEASGDRWNLGQNGSLGQAGYLPHPAKSHCQIARLVTAVLLDFNISNLTPLPCPRFVPPSPATPR